MDNAASTTHCPNEFRRARSPILREAERWLDIYFSGRSGSMPPVITGRLPIPSCRRRILLDIPWGQVVTYGDIARRLEAERGGRVSAQAVGGAVGHNLISLMIPCHRVIGAGGVPGRLCWRFAAQALSAGAGGRRCIRIARPLR